MAIHFGPFLLLVLVLAPLPTLGSSRRTLQAISPAYSPSYRYFAPASSLAPGSPMPSPGPPHGPKLPPPPSSGGDSGGGGGGFFPAKDGGGGGSSKGLSGGQKAGIVFGVLAGAGLVGFATVVFMKRKSNIRRARLGVLARRSQL